MTAVKFIGKYTATRRARLLDLIRKNCYAFIANPALYFP